MITLNIVKVSALVRDNFTGQVLWKRGDQTDKSQTFELSEFDNDIILNESFTKVSSFWKKNAN